MLGKFWKALKAGEMLSDPKKWKNRQSVGNAIGTIITFAVILLKKDVPVSIINEASMALGTLMWLGWNLYLTTATTKKIGFKGEKK